MKRDILVYPHPFLATKAASVARVDDSVLELIDDMFETMYEANGVGLAATQIGVGKRVVVVDVSHIDKKIEPMALINPEIVERQGCVVDSEGCLSVPGVEEDVPRADLVVVRALDPNGEQISFSARGLLSRAVQHEVDHLDGVLFIQRVVTKGTTQRF